MLYSFFPSISVRVIYGLITGFLISISLTPWAISRLSRLRIGQSVREDGVQSHLETKQGIPTMGGLIILVSVLISTAVWAQPGRLVLLVVLAFLTMGMLGFGDDFTKVVTGHSSGVSARMKLVAQALFALGLGVYLSLTDWIPHQTLETSLFVPIIGHAYDLGWFFIPFVMVVVVGTSNSVNLTDGLDGLAAGVIVWVTMAYAGIAYVAGNRIFSAHLAIPYVPGAGELTIVCAALIGACVGFLWYNAYPASIFMGDTGSLSMGAALGTVAVLVKNEVLLVLIGGIFVVEAISVMIQVGSYRIRGKRVFRMAPIHHHFELLGWAEPKVVIRFWIITIMLALTGLSLLGLNAIRR